MVLYLVSLVTVLAGFLFGGHFGGSFGSFLGGMTAMLLCLVVTDVFFYGRTLEGFVPRHRGSMTSFLIVILSVIVGSNFFGATWGAILGVILGDVLGRALIKQLGWGGEPAMQDLDARIRYLIYPAILVALEDPPHLGELKTLRKIARKWLQPVGLHHDQDMQNILYAARKLIDDEQASPWLQGMSKELRSQLLLDCLEIVHSRKDVHPDKKLVVENLETFLQLPDRACMEFYQREVTLLRLRLPALRVLGLPSDASNEQVDQTYRDAVRRFHPDRVQGVPDHLSELARAKIVELNGAYDILKTTDVASLKYTFRGHPGDDSFEPDGQSSFTCRCWICAQANRIPADVLPHSIRCGGCHAFLGIVPAR